MCMMPLMPTSRLPNIATQKIMLLMSKLRKELNISSEDHRAWVAQLQGAKAAGTLLPR
jgi:hypothetical protein